MKTEREATLEDLYEIDGKAELVDGEIVPMSPTGFLPGYAAGEIFAALREYAKRTRAGYALPDNVGFTVDMPRRRTFSPDAAFHRARGNMKFLEGAPLFAVEVRSEGDYGATAERKIAEKIADYFASGTEVVWDVDLLSDDVVRVYRRSDPKNPTIYHRGESVEAEPALPGWTLPVDNLFP